MRRERGGRRKLYFALLDFFCFTLPTLPTLTDRRGRDWFWFVLGLGGILGLVWFVLVWFSSGGFSLGCAGLV